MKKNVFESVFLRLDPVYPEGWIRFILRVGSGLTLGTDPVYLESRIRFRLTSTRIQNSEKNMGRTAVIAPSANTYPLPSPGAT